MSTETTPSYRGYWALIISQFQGAFNDHAFKNLLLLVALSLDPSVEHSNKWSSLIPAVFIAPFLLFAMHSGFLADRYSKRTIIIGTKWLEIAIMLGAGLAFLSGHLYFGLLMLFLAGTQAAYYGPSKYGILPELVREKHLSWANGIIELTTFAAIILGTFAGTLFFVHFKASLHYAALVLTGLSVLGLAASYRIDEVQAA
ncbi:MAG TPA: MFS transporter, partial [Candidatus Ozemobacteraceae bacterium]|nr:MFS transporter [Candidatus Ozemobacteraceae bacterium]